MQQYRIRCHKNGNIAAFTIKNFTKDQLFLTEYLQNKLHSFNELIYFPKNQGFYRILKQKQVVFDTTFQKCHYNLLRREGHLPEPEVEHNHRFWNTRLYGILVF